MNIDKTPTGATRLRKSNSKKASKHGIRRMEIEPSDNGGFMVHTHFQQQDKEPYSYKEPDKAVFQDVEGLHGHLDKHFGKSKEGVKPAKPLKQVAE